jgi:hypothetical protein
VHIGSKDQATLESNHRASKGVMDLALSRGCNLGAQGCYAGKIPTSFLRFLKFWW